MTGRVIGQRAIPACAYINNFQNIHQIFAEFECAFCQRLCTRQPPRISGKEFRIVVLDHVRARTGRSEHITWQVLEGLDHVFGHLARVTPQASVELWLPTACLCQGKIYSHSQTAKDADDCFGRLWVECIDQTGYKELYGRHNIIVIPVCPT